MDISKEIPRKLSFFDHLGRVYYYLSIPFSLIFKPFYYSKYYRANFLPLYRLINHSFTKSPVLTFFAIWYPLIFILILTYIMPVQQILWSIGMLIPTTIGMQLLPTLLVEFKQSSLLKRIGATHLETWMLAFCFITYFIYVSFLSIIFNLGVGIIIHWNTLQFENIIDFGQYFFALLLDTIVAISVGMAISAVAKKPSAATLIGLLFILPGGFLSGQFVSFNYINVVPALKYIGFIFPQKWPTLLGVIATSGQSIWDLNPHCIPSELNPTEMVELANRTVVIMAWIMPFVMSAIALVITIRFFKWQAR